MLPIVLRPNSPAAKPAPKLLPTETRAVVNSDLVEAIAALDLLFEQSQFLLHRANPDQSAFACS
jgi:hypothetical protein